MTFQRLCNLVTKGDYNYYSKQFDIVIEPLRSDSQTTYRVSVIRNKEPVEVIDIEPPIYAGESSWSPEFVRDKILATKQELHAKHLLV
jgi:hypothetical protein